MIKLFVSRMKYYLFAIFLLAIQSCSNLEYKPLMTRMTAITPTDIFSHTHNGSLFQEKILLNNGYQPLFEDHRPHNVGDTITIVLQENINASNSSSSDFSKNGSSSFGASIDASPLNSLLNLNLQDNKTGLDSAGKNDFSGRSNNSAKNKFTGLITVTVHKVLPNGNLQVLGEKQVSINKGQELIRFSGIINPNNINQNNLIASTQVADAHIAYLSHGNISDSQEMGWLQKFLLKISPI